MKNEITLESVRLRLMELHPDVHTSAGLDIWSHGGVTVALSLHPKELKEGCWYISVKFFLEEDRPIAARIEEALTSALARAEAGLWDKPPAVVVAELAAARAGRSP